MDVYQELARVSKNRSQGERFEKPAVIRTGNGHTEGLEPKITEELVQLMLSAKGDKIQQAQ